MQEEYKEKESEKPESREKKSYVKKILKVILYIVLGLIVFNLVLFLLLSIPSVQQKVIGFAIGKVEEMTGAEMRVEQVRLDFWGNVGAKLEGVYIEDQSKDTLLYARRLEARLNPVLLLKNKLLINKVEAEDFIICVSQANPGADFNFQFLIDAFAGDTTSDESSGSMQIAIDDIRLSNGRLRYDVLSEAETPGQFNASHIGLANLYSDLNLPSVDAINFEGHINSLSFSEKSGLDITGLKGDVTSSLAVFYLKNTELLLPNSKLAISSAEYNMLTGAFTVVSGSSVISPLDVLPFMRDLKHLKNNIVFETSLSGKLPAISVDNLQATYGNDAQLKGSAYISDYSDYGNADLKLDIAGLRISPAAIGDFAKIGDSTFVAPDILNTLGSIRLNAVARGTLAKMDVNAEAITNQGALLMLAKASTDTTFENFSANIKLQTQNFNLATLMEMPELGRLSADMNVLAAQTSAQSLKADVTGRVHTFQYDSLRFDNVPFTGYYNAAKMGGWLRADQPFGKLEAKVDMTQAANPQIDIDAGIDRLRIDKFAELPDWHNPQLSLRMKGKVTGTDLSRIQADVTIDSLRFTHDSLSFEPGVFALKAGLDEDPMKKYIHMTSSLFEAGVTGDYNFETLPGEIAYMMNAYLPGLFEQPRKTLPGKNNFKFYLTVKNTEELGRILDLPVNVIDPLSFTGSLDMPANGLKMSARIPHLKYDDMDIRNTAIDIYNSDSLINIGAKSRLALESGDIKFSAEGSVLSDTIGLRLNARRDSLDLDVDINLDAKANFAYSGKGDLISAVRFSPSTMDIGKLNLTFMPAHIVNEGTRTSVSNFGFMAGRGRVLNKYFGLDGTISDQPQDTLNVSFFHSNLGYILRAFDIDNISTIANGDIKLTNIMSVPEMYTDNLKFTDIIVFGDTLGNLNIDSQWNNARGAIRLDALLAKNERKSTVKGWVYPESDSLNLKINVDRLSLNWLEPFMAGMLNRVSGSVSTGLSLQGKITAPAVNGWLGVNDTYLGIDYTNVVYHISDTIEVTPGKIGFDRLMVSDPDNNKARVSALVTHKDFKNMEFSLGMTFRDFMVLNTPSRTDSLFYGKLYATGTADIKGNMDDIKMDLRVRNAKQSRIDVLIPQTSDAGVYESIVYINTPDEGKDKEAAEPEMSLPMNLAANITLSPTVTLGVVINPLTGDEMQIKGNGIVDFTYDMESETMNAIGNYSVTDGFVKLKLQNLVTMQFKIKEGSKLVFNGDPLRTKFDITAYKRVRADLRTLDANFGQDGTSSPRVMVDCVLGITGNMDRMDLTYDISLPDSDEDVTQRVNSLIVTDQQKVTQFASLLAIGSFQSQGTGAPGGNIAESMLTNVAGSAMSAALNSMFSKVIGTDWQIGTNIASDDGTFNNMDMTVSLSRKFLDDKLEFNTNLGYRTDQSNDNSFIGDFDVSYALTRSIKLKVFNRTNDRYYTQANMTQGIGVVYTREAKTIKELFRFFRKRRPWREGGREQQQTTPRQR